MNENKKNTGLKLVVAALVIALAVCFIQISELSNRITQQQNAMQNQHQRFMNQVESIYDNVDQMLKEEASLLSGVEAEYGELNLEDHTIDVSVKLVPRLISENMKVRVSIDGRSIELSRNGNTFSGTIAVDIYNVGELMLMSIDTAAGTQTQYLPEIQVEYLWDERIPSLYHCDLSGTGKLGEGKYTLTGMLDINCSAVEQTPNVSFEKFVLVTELNGNEINREDISQDVLNFPNYPHGVYFREDYTMECEAKEGDELIIRLEATDTLGYVHKMVLHFWKEQNGAVAEAINGSEFIYDAAGNLIYGKE